MTFTNKPLKCLVCRKDIIVGQMANLLFEDGKLVGVVHMANKGRLNKACIKEIKDGDF